MRRAPRTAVAATALLTALATSASFAAAGANHLIQVSTSDPVAGCTAGSSSGHNYPNAETEPFVSVDPNHSRHSIVTWQQDRWTNGGAHTGAYAWTSDGNHYKVGVLPFGVCAGADSFPRISDLWVSWGPDGVAYSSALEFDEGGAALTRNAVGAATTFDGGATWKFPQTVSEHTDPAFGEDKNSVTADQLHPGVAYQVWDTIFQPIDPVSGNATAFDGSAFIAITHDHGKTYTPYAKMVDTTVTPFTQTIGNIIVEAPSGKLYDFFNLVSFNDANTDIQLSANYAFVTSTDQGATWSKPKLVTPDTSVAEVDPNDPSKALRAGSGLESEAIDPASGKIYLAYEGSDFSGGNFNQIQLVSSSDGGATWTAPALVSKAGVPAFTPTVAVDHLGTLNLSYYDLRFLQPGNTTTLPTARFAATFCGGNLANGTEQQVTPVFDWLQAPNARGFMLGDYEGMAPAGTFGVQSVFVTTMNAPADQSDVFSATFHGPFGGAVGHSAVASSARAPSHSHGAHVFNR